MFQGLNALFYLNLYNFRGRDIFISLNPIKNLQICTNNPDLTEEFRFLKNKKISLVCLPQEKTSQTNKYRSNKDR